jgi:hypothetical protein
LRRTVQLRSCIVAAHIYSVVVATSL